MFLYFVDAGSLQLSSCGRRGEASRTTSAAPTSSLKLRARNIHSWTAFSGYSVHNPNTKRRDLEGRIRER
eukprot:499149-Heterocapsa_arctica.AAC.1